VIDLDKTALEMLEVSKNILDIGEALVPMAFIIAADGRWSIYGLMFKDPPSKVVMYYQLSEHARQVNAAAVYLINDTWVRLSNLPGEKFEALYAQLVMPDASVMKSITIPYFRQSGGQIKWGPPAISDNPETTQNLLPAWGKCPTAS
jgi:hypothetical protein